MEGDSLDAYGPEQSTWNFNPLPPHGGRHNPEQPMNHQQHFNPLPPHGGRPGAGPFRTPRNAFQSTPSAWRETNTHIWLRFVITISIHSLRMEGDERPQQAGKTPAHFNPLPPHGGRHYALRGIFVWMHISIHSLRMEGDCGGDSEYDGNVLFQSTPSAWRETAIRRTAAARENISIHSLRMEGDRRRPSR